MDEQFTFFWNGPFSQWYNSPFTVMGVTYPTAEHWMMVGKAKIFGDIELADTILKDKNPANAKASGRLVKGFEEEKWNKNKLNIVYAGNYHKFVQHKDLARLLLATAGTTLVEASPYDRIWGIGLRETDPLALNRKTWKGTNLLGEVLTSLRDNLIKQGLPFNLAAETN